MRARRTRRAGAGCACAILVGVACGSHTGLHPNVKNVVAPPADNVAEVSVDYGLPDIGYLNGLFAKVTVCVPGSTSDCQTIDHVLVDTGSSGLRLLGSVLTISLPALTDDNGATLAECGQFISGALWGPLRTADFSIANEQARNLVVHVSEKATYPMPTGCTGTDISDPNDLAANGILGVGTPLQDCGSDCAARVGSKNSPNPGTYFACASAAADGCQPTAVPLAKQVSNPVAFFSQDNNGAIVELPAIPAEGAPNVVGSLVFGIGTRDNNGLELATVIPLNSMDMFRTKYPTNGVAVFGFADSGSNAIFFLDSATTKIPTCSSAKYPGISAFYCPTSRESLSARIEDASGQVGVNVNFGVANFMSLSRYNFAFDDVAGPSAAPDSGGTFLPTYFDWGLPFYFGKNVFTSIEGEKKTGYAGPFVAF